MDIGYICNLVEKNGWKGDLEVNKKLKTSSALEVRVKSKEMADKIRDTVDTLAKETFGNNVSTHSALNKNPIL